MADLLSAFPPRPLHPRPPGLMGPILRPMLGVAVFAFMLIGVLAWLLPTALGDWQVRTAAVPIRGGHLLKNSCNEKLFLNICDLTLEAPQGSGTATRQVSYLFSSFDTGRLRARVVGDPARPDLLTTDLGLERFWNRVLMLLLFCAALVGGAAASLRRSLRAEATRRAWHGAATVPVPLTLVATRDRTWTVRTEGGREARWRVPMFARPFVLGPADRVAGLVTRNGGSVMPLDSRLAWVVLTVAERRAIRAARR